MDVRIDIEQTDILLSAYEDNSLTSPENDKLTACALELVSSIILSVSIFIIVLLLFVVFVYYCCLGFTHTYKTILFRNNLISTMR